MAEPRRIALMPGDGIGQEVMAAAAEVLQALDKLTPLGLSWDWLEWPSTDWHRRHGEMMPADAMTQVQSYDALLMGALGDPGHSVMQTATACPTVFRCHHCCSFARAWACGPVSAQPGCCPVHRSIWPMRALLRSTCW